MWLNIYLLGAGLTFGICIGNGSVAGWVGSLLLAATWPISVPLFLFLAWLSSAH